MSRKNNNNNIRRAASPGGNLEVPSSNFRAPSPGFNANASLGINAPTPRFSVSPPAFNLNSNSTMTATMQSVTETMKATRVSTDSSSRSPSPSPLSANGSISHRAMTKRTRTASIAQTMSTTFEGVNAEMSLSKIAEQLSVDEETGALIATDVLIQEQPIQMRFELANHLGVFQKKLAWNYRNYHDDCKEIRIITEDDKVFIQAIYDADDEESGEDEDIGPLRFDLTEVLCIYQGQLQIRLSSMVPMSTTLSEVPWMKFKVVAEPDYAMFAQDPVMKMMLSHIAQSTAEFVMLQMKHKISEAIDVSIAAVMSSAMQHVTEEMQTMVQRVGMMGKAQMAATGYESLHITAFSP